LEPFVLSRESVATEEARMVVISDVRPAASLGSWDGSCCTTRIAGSAGGASIACSASTVGTSWRPFRSSAPRVVNSSRR